MAAPLLSGCFGLEAEVRAADGGGPDAEQPSNAADGGGPDVGAGCAQPSTARDFYVDHSAATGSCRFPTIAAALSAANAVPCNCARTIHLAPGTYSTATGESFPIELRGGVSIAGAGAASIVTGTGAVNVSPPSNRMGALSSASAIRATFLAGDVGATTSISSLSIVAPAGGNSAGQEAIVCDRGNAATPAPAPNTWISGVTLRGFEAGVRVTWARPPQSSSGCNALITSSTIRDGAYGVVADGRPALQPVSVRLGDSATDGNMLLNFDYSNQAFELGGAGLVVCDAVTGVVVRGNTFAQETGAREDFGIWAFQTTYDQTGMDIEDNTFGPILNEGIGLFGNVAVARFVHNTVQGVSMGTLPQYGWAGVGLSMGMFDISGAPFIAYARGNTFVGNDIAVDFRSSTQPLSNDPTLQSDFGTASDPGGNEFRCNSVPANLAAGGYPGGDVWMDLRVPTPSAVVVPFQGNVWDHAPPTLLFANGTAPVPNGIDVMVYATPADGGADATSMLVGGSLDTSHATTSSLACPANSVPGP
jgi:hypothetical protein